MYVRVYTFVFHCRTSQQKSTTRSTIATRERNFGRFHVKVKETLITATETRTRTTTSWPKVHKTFSFSRQRELVVGCAYVHRHSYVGSLMDFFQRISFLETANLGYSFGFQKDMYVQRDCVHLPQFSTFGLGFGTIFEK